VALKGKLGVFPCFEVDVIRLYLDLGVSFVMLFDDADKPAPVSSIYDSFRQRRNLIETGVNSHGCR
jgi:hypothetical protein